MTVYSQFYRDSSFIDHVSWDSDYLTLSVRFVSGTVWMYHEVPQSVYRSLLKAKSVGSYFNKNIRDKYPSEKYFSQGVSLGKA